MASVRKLDPSDPKSPWVCEYTDAAGKRRRKTPKTGLKKDADAIKRKVEAELERGEHIAPSEALTVEQLCDEFMRHTDAKVRDGLLGRSRRAALRGVVDNHIVPAFGATKLPDLTERTVGLFYRELVDGKGHNPYGASKILRDLQFIQRFAIKRGLMKHKPVSDALSELRGISPQRIRTFSVADVQQLLATVETKAHWGRRHTHALLRCYVNIAAFCGLRRGEIDALTPSTVDFHRMVIRVRANLDQQNDSLKGPKSKAGIRDVPMPKHVGDLVQAYMAEHGVANPQGLIFRNRLGKRVAKSFIMDLWRPLLERADLGPDAKGVWFRFHALRHFCASWMISNGLPVTDVALLLGHSSFDVTLQVYAHPVMGDEWRHAVVERMAAALPRSADGKPTRLIRDIDAQTPEMIASV